MRVGVTGSSGLVGSALVPALRAGGHEVTRLVRAEPRAADERRWRPYDEPDPAPFRGLDAVVHLAGAGVGDHRWTTEYKRTIRQSRVVPTATLSRSLAALETPPTVLLCGSAIGWYGETGDRAVDESAPAGTGFLAELCTAWEAASLPAEQAGIRVARLRTGIVLDRRSGVLGRLLPPFRWGVGGRLGNGRQYMSYISIADEIGAIEHLLSTDVTGAVNLTAPTPVTNAEFTRELGRLLGRPAMFRVPAAALRIAMGELSDDALASQRVLPRRLQESGYRHLDPDVRSALKSALSHG